MKNIFISSTFRDMQAERDMVHERVVPFLREEARKHGENVDVIDLRWGVDTSMLESDEGSAKVLEVCLDEIDRSHPYMLIFLGERYGWIPNSELIKHAIENRQDKYSTDDFAKSVTALEIEYGALSENYGRLDQCIVCIRDDMSQMLDGDIRDKYVDCYDNPKLYEEAEKKLKELKDKFTNDVRIKDRLINYSVGFDFYEKEIDRFYVGETPLEEVLVKKFKEMFKEEWEQLDELSWQEREQLVFASEKNRKLRCFAGREEELEKYYYKIKENRTPFVLKGETGCGKSTIICKLIDKLEKDKENVFVFLVEVSDRSTSAEDLVCQLVYYVEKLLGLEEHYEDCYEAHIQGGSKQEEKIEYINWIAKLDELLEKLSTDVYIVIDDLDKLCTGKADVSTNISRISRLSGVLLKYHEKVHFVVTCTNSLVNMVLIGQKEICLPALEKEECIAVAKAMFESYYKNPYNQMVQAIADKAEKNGLMTPIYISAMVQCLNMMDADVLTATEKETEIIANGMKIIDEMPANLEAAMYYVLNTAIKKFEDEFVSNLRKTLHFIAISRNGLCLKDVNGLLKESYEFLDSLEFARLQKYMSAFFGMRKGNRICFSNKLIHNAILKEIPVDANYEFYFNEYIKKLDKNDPLRLTDGMYFARKNDDVLFAMELIRQTNEIREKEFLNALVEDAIADGGCFYIKIIDWLFYGDDGMLDFFLTDLLFSLGKKEEHRVYVRIAEKLAEILSARLYPEMCDGYTPEGIHTVKKLIDCYIGLANHCVYEEDGSAQGYLDEAFEYANELKNHGDVKEGRFQMFRILNIKSNLYDAQGFGGIYFIDKILEEYEGLDFESLSDRELELLASAYHSKAKGLMRKGEQTGIDDCLSAASDLVKIWEQRNPGCNLSYITKAISDLEIDCLIQFGSIECAIETIDEILDANMDIYNQLKNVESFKFLIFPYMYRKINCLYRLDRFYDLTEVFDDIEELLELYADQMNDQEATIYLLSMYSVVGIAYYRQNLKNIARSYIDKVIHYDKEVSSYVTLVLAELKALVFMYRAEIEKDEGNYHYAEGYYELA